MIDAPHSRLLRAVIGHAQAMPGKIALVEGTRRVTYSQLISNVEKVAGYLSLLGLKPGDTILLAAQKEVEFIYLYLAAHLLGIVNVVVDSASPADRIDYIISTVSPAAKFGTIWKVNRPDFTPFSEVLPDLVTPSLAMREIHSTDVADVMFTTGTTGAPKGVCLSHDNIAGSACNTNGFIGTRADDVEALALPLSHSFGLGRMRCVLMAGATLVLVGSFANLKAFFQVLEAENVTGFGMVPAVWQYIKRISGTRISKFASQIRYIEFGSAALPVADKRLLMDIFPHTRLCMHYGLTEASRAIFSEFHACADNLETIGQPASSLVQVRILDEDGQPVEDGTDGEICVRGNMVTRTYYLPSDNQGAFFGDWFRTGDWGHRSPQGDFYLTGRKKELINVGGEKVSPAAIEQAIMALGIKDCACVAIPDPKGVLGEVPKAFLVKSDPLMTIEEVKKQLIQVLPAHEVPVEWEWVDSIPRTSSGKIQRLKLKN